MKAFIIGVAAMIVIATGAGFTLESIATTSGEKYTTDSVRLGDLK
ncbi:MAG: hypothetical protein RIC36_00540 [Rhodospirillales bacterium]